MKSVFLIIKSMQEKRKGIKKDGEEQSRKDGTAGRGSSES